MKALLLTNEYPPYVYGGAGVHVDYLTRELSKLCPVEVRAFGDQKKVSGNLAVKGFALRGAGVTAPRQFQIGFGALERSLAFNAEQIDANVVHCHTWYTHFGGILAKLHYGIPLVITVHSLEPLRPWKREQLGGGYDFSCWVEKTALEMADAVIGVSKETRQDVLKYFNVRPERVHVIYNGIDTKEYRPIQNPAQIRKLGIDPNRPFILFVGRVTRQKGILYFLNAIRYLDPGFQIVLCAGAPDTPEIASEMEGLISRVSAQRSGVIWLRENIGLDAKVALYSHAELFVCPSIYEPFGIINLEAMACETAVVASAVGGIKEVVIEGETGSFVTLRQKKESPFEPLDPDRFERDLARKINDLMAKPELRKKMGKAGRKRAVDIFSWKSIAQQTLQLYKSLL